MKVGGIVKDSLVDGIGIRFAIFLTGCPHQCDGCHNPEMQKYNTGYDYYISDLLDMIRMKRDWITGITLTGGDPIFQEEEVKEFLRQLRKDEELKDMNVWLYTGYLFEELNKGVTQYVDVIVDGKYDKTLAPQIYSGSSNQRYFKRYPGTNKFEQKEESELAGDTNVL